MNSYSVFSNDCHVFSKYMEISIHILSLYVYRLTTENKYLYFEILPLELKLFYKDGLHLSNLGLKLICGTILSKLYSILAPDVKRSRVSKRNSNRKHRTINHDDRYGQAVSSSLTFGCWNMQYFRAAQLHFKNIINKFHIFAISEHCLFTDLQVPLAQKLFN